MYNNYNFTHHYDHQRQYIKIVNDIKNRINKENLKKHLIIKINKNIFKINEIKNFHYLNGYEFNTFYLNFYLNNSGLSSAWIQDIQRSTFFNKIGFNTNKVFPVSVFDNYLEKIDVSKEGEYLSLRYHNNNSPRYILVSDIEQERFAAKYFSSKNISFQTIFVE